MRNFILLITSTLLFSCISESELKDVFPIHLLNASSSKVWILIKSNDPEMLKVPEVNAYRKCFIFYSNHSFREQELIYLGSSKGVVGKYSIRDGEKGSYILRLYYPSQNGKVVQYNIQKIENKRLILQLESDAENPLIIDLRPLPPPPYSN